MKGYLRPAIVNRSREGKAYRYSFNFILWSELKDFVTALLEYQILRLVEGCFLWTNLLIFSNRK